MKSRMLPYLEQLAIFNAINFTRFVSTTSVNGTASTTTVNTFLCPSDANNPISNITIPTGSFPAGQNNYGNNIGTCRTFNGNTFDGPAWQLGNSSYGPVLTLASILDGTSNTAMFSEWVRGKNTQQIGLNMVYASSISFSTTAPGTPQMLATLQLTLQTYAATCTSKTLTNYTNKGRCLGL